jgi:hypothetical protein
MVRIVLSLLSFALVASTQASFGVSSHPDHPDLAARVVSSHVPRQDAGVDMSDIPADCKTACDPITKIYTDSSCTSDAKCICKDATLTGYADCAMCVVGLVEDDKKPEATDQVKAALTRLAGDCEREAGVKLNVPSVTEPSSSSKQDTANTNVAEGTALGLRLSPGIKLTAVIGGVAILFL